MKKDKFQITMPELQKLIKEEYASMANNASRAEEIQARLKAINEELKTLPTTLSEVEAAGLKGVKSTGWTGAGEEDKKYDEKFEKIGTHLKEDEEIEGEIEVGGEEMEGGPEMGMEAEPEMGYFELKFAELGKELDTKVGGDEMEAPEMEVEMGDEMGDEEGAMEGAMEGLAEMEETKHEPIEGTSLNPEALEEVVAEDEEAEVVAEEEEVDVEETINEDLEEPIEGSTPAQDSDARFNDYMEKDKHVKEGTQKVGTTLLSEGYSAERKSKMDAELERMKKLAKI
jgi:hypothetical protein